MADKYIYISTNWPLAVDQYYSTVFLHFLLITNWKYCQMKQKLHFQHVVAAAAEIWDFYSISDLKIDFTLCKPNPSLQSHSYENTRFERGDKITGNCHLG